jgi:peroxiredoxin Q/BCP
MLKIGDQAPNFELPSDSGETVRRKDFSGRSLIVYFYPKDDTPGCTREAIAFSEAMKRFSAAGASIVGISKDSVASHGKFRDKHALKIPLLSDADLSVHKAFGAFGEKTMYGKKVMGTIRSTFVVGPDGTITKVFPSVKVDGHADAVLAVLSGAPPKAAKSPAPKKVPAKKATKTSAKR